MNQIETTRKISFVATIDKRGSINVRKEIQKKGFSIGTTTKVTLEKIELEG